MSLLPGGFRPLHLGIAAVAGVAVGGTAAFWWAQHQTETAANSHPALKHGAPVTGSLRTFSGYVAEFDPRLRNPKFVLEVISANSVRGKGTRTDSYFVEDSAMDPRFRSRLDSFRQSGYDRGHMAPAANHKSSQQAMDDTFVLTNICPQVGQGFNRGYWARFERFVWELTQRNGDVYVVTGPLYLPQPNAATGGWQMAHPMLGSPPQLTAVPTHFFKVVLAEDGTNTATLGAFVMPNTAIDPKTPLSAFVVPISALEEVAGMEFFPKFLRREKRLALDEISLQWQQLGRESTPQLQLTGEQHLTLLPAPEGVIRQQQGVMVVKRNGKQPESPGQGMRHICEYNGCKLPREDWWKSNGKKEQLRRTQSLPVLHQDGGGKGGGGGGKR